MKKKKKTDEKIKPIQKYRDEELEHMYKSFYDANSSFNKLRCEFVYKVTPKHTPKRLALHRKD